MATESRETAQATTSDGETTSPAAAPRGSAATSVKHALRGMSYADQVQTLAPGGAAPPRAATGALVQRDQKTPATGAVQFAGDPPSLTPRQAAADGSDAEALLGKMREALERLPKLVITDPQVPALLAAILSPAGIPVPAID